MKSGSSLISFRQIEQVGERAVEEYIRQEGVQEQSFFDVEGFTERFLGIKVRYELFDEEDRSLIGFLSNGLEPLKVIRDGFPVSVIFQRDTAVIDSRLLREKEDGRRRFTIAHEAGHRLLEMHMLSPEAEASFRSDWSAAEEHPEEYLMRMFSVTEAMADRMAAVLLMPRSYVMRALEELNSGQGPAVYAESVITDRDRKLIEDAAGMLRVSRTALFSRLRELRLVRYLPAAQYRV